MLWTVEWMRRHSKITVSLLSLLSAMGMALYAPFQQADAVIPTFDLFSDSIFSLLFRGLFGLLAGFFLSRFVRTRLTPRRFRYALWVAALLSLTCAVGAELQVHGTLRPDWPAVLSCFLCWLGLWAFLLLSFLWIMARGKKILRWLGSNSLPTELSLRGFLAKRSIALFLFIQAALLLFWLPIWLAYFPGLANYDILSHMEQCITQSYSTLHPLLYTLLLKACLWLAALLGGETTLAISLLCWLQMLFMSGALSYGMVQMKRYGAGTVACVLVFLFFAVFPVFPLLAISTTKDVPFASLALSLMIQIFSLFHCPKRFLASWKSCLFFVLTGVLMGLLRYNGIVSLAVFTVITLFLRQASGKQQNTAKEGIRIKSRVTALLALTSLLTWLGTLGLNAATQATPSFVTMRDMASLPSQQLVRAVLEMEPDSAEYQRVLQWYSGTSMLEKYRPRLADYTKRYINVDHDNGWRGFAETWLASAKRHPKAYVEAFLELNRGLWFVHDLSHANIYPEGLPKFGYLLNNQVDCAEHIDGCTPTVFISQFPKLQSFYNALTTENLYLKVPILRMVFSIGFQCWVSVLLFFAACYRKDRALVYAMGWILCLLALLALAPAVLIRYTLPVFLGNGMGVLALARRSVCSEES